MKPYNTALEPPEELSKKKYWYSGLTLRVSSWSAMAWDTRCFMEGCAAKVENFGQSLKSGCWVKGKE